MHRLTCNASHESSASPLPYRNSYFRQHVEVIVKMRKSMMYYNEIERSNWKEIETELRALQIKKRLDPIIFRSVSISYTRYIISLIRSGWLRILSDLC